MASASPSITVLVVDDHPLLREGIAAVLALRAGMHIVGEAGDGREAIDMHRRLAPDVTLMDLQMPGVRGLEAIAAIKAATPQARILVLTTFPSSAQAASAIGAGAAGYMRKSSLRRSLIDAIEAVHNGRTWTEPDWSAGLDTAVPAELTIREVDVLGHVAHGRSNREVGELLSISEDAVKARLKSILAKLAAKDRTHAVTIARRRGLLGG